MSIQTRLPMCNQRHAAEFSGREMETLDMQTAATAVMVLLSCSPNGLDCKEMVGEELFETVGTCREALPGTLHRMTTPSRHVIGRCAEAAPQVPDIDPIVTGTIERGEKAINVTRFIDGKPVTTEYVVPAAD